MGMLPILLATISASLVDIDTLGHGDNTSVAALPQYNSTSFVFGYQARLFSSAIKLGYQARLFSSAIKLE